MHRKANHQAIIQRIEADVDIGFVLVDEARAYRLSGQPEFSQRALENAAEIVTDIERRLAEQGNGDAAAFLPLLEELRKQVADAARDEA
jgi:hypothetical protein